MTLPTLFVSHGGGPWPWMPEMKPYYSELNQALQNSWKNLSHRPSAIVCITAHWESNLIEISSGVNPSMIYDYGGFPEHTYKIEYNAPGSPEVASHLYKLLTQSGIATRLNPDRGFDHGTFVPLFVMNQAADIPVVQLSLRSDLDPNFHFKVGEAISSLAEENILIVGSGLSFHNLRLFNHQGANASKVFDNWLTATLTNAASNYEECKRHLIAWKNAPSARESHPREEHLIPLFVALGASSTKIVHKSYFQHDFMGGLTISNFTFS